MHKLLFVFTIAAVSISGSASARYYKCDFTCDNGSTHVSKVYTDGYFMDVNPEQRATCGGDPQNSSCCEVDPKTSEYLPYCRGESEL